MNINNNISFFFSFQAQGGVSMQISISSLYTEKNFGIPTSG